MKTNKKPTPDQKRIEQLEQELAAEKKSSANWEACYRQEFKERRVDFNKEGIGMGMAEARQNVAVEAIYRAHQELNRIKPTEINASILHRAIGAAQGILAAAVQGQIPFVNLYDEENGPDPRGTSMIGILHR